MLKTNQNITLTGISEIGGQQVAYLSASISTDGATNASVNKTITNQELYNANKAECREDMNKFEAAVYAVEDSLTTAS